MSKYLGAQFPELSHCLEELFRKEAELKPNGLVFEEARPNSRQTSKYLGAQVHELSHCLEELFRKEVELQPNDLVLEEDRPSY